MVSHDCRRLRVLPLKVKGSLSPFFSFFRFLKQMQSKTPMTIVLRDGEIISGVIEWYDKDCLKVNREGDPNLLLFKANIKYMYKVGE